MTITVPNSTPVSLEGESSMQAWLHTHLDNYVKLNILNNVPAPGESSWKNGTALLCLAHRFCPAAVPDLLGTLHNENIEKAAVAIQILHDEFKVSTTKDQLDDIDVCMAYITAVRAAVEENEPTVQTMRLTQANLVSETQWIQVTRRTRESTAGDDEFERRTTVVLDKVHYLRSQLNDMTLLTTSTSSHAINADASEKKSGEDAEENKEDEGDLASRVEKFESELAELREKDNVELQAYIQSLPDDARITLSGRIQTINAALAALDSHVQEDLQAIHLAVLFAQLTTPIRGELKYIQTKMINTATTEDGIRDLEERTRHAGKMINTMEEEHNNMLGEGKMYRFHFNALKQKHALISSWVDEVRVWFVETERIRRWIEERIQEINSHPLCDPLLTVDLSDYTLAIADQLTSAHEALQKQVEKFNKEDLTRLRAHATALTGVEKEDDKDLSPADTTTIGIILATQETHKRLTHLMKRRSYDLEMLTLRLFWEQECAQGEEWVNQAGVEVADLLQKARWTFEEEKTMDWYESDNVKNLVVHTLLDIEQRVSDFDRGQFTTVINMYQEMDKASKVDLSAHLEARQVALEENFEALTKRVGYVRQVVEQRVTVMNFVYCADELVDIGERLKEEMAVAEQQAVAGDSDREFIDRIRRFQEQAVQLVTAIAIRIRYPELLSPNPDAEGNHETNTMIRALISQRKSAVILSGDMLDQRLVTYQNILELLSKAEQLNKELRQLEVSMEDQVISAKKITEDVLASKCIFTQDDIPRLRKEYDDCILRSESVRAGDLKRLQCGIDAVRKEGQRHSAVATQIDRLDNVMGRLGKLLDELDPKLAAHHIELEALQLRLDWEKNLEGTLRLISDTSKNAFFFIEKTQWRPITKASVHLESRKIELDTLQHEANNIKDGGHLDSLSGYYSAMIDKLSHILGDNTIPEHFGRRQESIESAYDRLKDCVEFAQAVLNQRVAMIEYLDQVAAAHDSGTGLLEQVERAIRTVMTKDRQSFHEDIEEFGARIEEVWNSHGKTIPYPDRPRGVSSYGASSDDANFNDEVKYAVSSEYAKLRQLHERLVHANKFYMDTTKFKETMQSYTNEAENLEKMISDAAKAIILDQQNLAADVIDPQSSPIPSELKESNTEHTRRVELLKMNMDDLQDRSTCLITSIEESESRSSVPTAMLSTALARLAGGGKELLHIAEMHSRELNVYELRVGWEQKISEAISKAYELQDQLRVLNEEKNTLHRSARIDEKSLTIWKDKAAGTWQLLAHALEHFRSSAEESYERMLTGYKTLQLNTPLSVDDRQQDMITSFAKLSDNVSQMNKELDLLSDRAQCERATDDFLSSCATQEKRIDSFIQNKARWSSESQETVDLNDAFDELKVEVSSYGQDATDVINSIRDLVEVRNLTFSESLVRRKHDIRLAVSKLENLLAYAQEVDGQRQKFKSILDTAMHLEEFAESLLQQIHDGIDVTDSLAQLSKEVKSFSHDACSITYPVRDQLLSDSRSRSLDNTANAVIQEMLHVRQSKVEKLPELLADAVRSRQLQDEKNAAVDAYMAESHGLCDWIQSRLDAIEDALSKSSSCSAEELQSAVMKIDAVSSSVKANEDTFNTLTVKSMKLGDNDDVQQRQSELKEAWNQLTARLGPNTKAEMAARLHQAEYRESVEQLTEKRQNLQASFDNSNVPDLTDDQLAKWRQETDALKTHLYETIGPSAGDEHEREIYTCLVGEHATLVSSLDDLAKKLKNYSLLKDFKDRAGSLTVFFTETTTLLEKLRHELGTITGVSEDETRCRLFNDECGAIYRAVQERMDSYHNLKSFYRALEIQKIDVAGISKEHDQLDQTHRDLERSLEAARSASGLAIQWKDLHSTLGLVESEIKKIDDTLKTGDGDNAEAQLAAVDARLATVSAMADKLGENESQDANRASFQQRYGRVFEDVSTTKEKLKVVEEEAKKRADLQAFSEAANRIKKMADEECLHIKDRIEKVDNICQQADKEVSLLENQYRSRVTEAARSAFEILGDLNEQLVELEKVRMDDKALALACDSVTGLKNMVDSEQKLNDFLRQTIGHARSADNISRWIDDCRNAIRAASANMGPVDDKDVEDDVEEIQLKVTKFQDFIQSFDDLTQKLLNDESILDGAIKDSASLITNAIIRSRAIQIESEWRSLQSEFSELQVLMARVSKGVEIVRQMKKILSICGDARERVGRLESDSKMLTLSPFNGHSLSGMLREQEVLTVEQELDAIEAKLNEQIAQEIGKLDEKIRDYNDTDGTFVQQCAEMGTAISSLTATIEDKRKELSRALDVGRCLVITDDIDVLVSALEDAATKATAEEGENVSKPDLRARSIELDARYKYYERKIAQSLDAAQLTADDIANEDDREMVLRHVRELREHWEVVEREVQALKTELNKALVATPDRARKSSLPTRRASHFLRDRDRSPSRLPVVSSIHSNTSSPLLSAASRLAPSTSIPRIRPTGSVSATNSRLTPPTTRQFPSKSVSNSKLPKPQATPTNKYVADPHNDLDIQIGRIVNETPYKVKVKMVPGDVGRYWFGDMNPKLAYCRVLKSKMVMVRVGGGWMELSQFLRNHALFEGDFIPRKSEPQAPDSRIQEGFIETRKQRVRRERSPSGQGPAPIHASRSTLQDPNAQRGFVEGDRYIAVDKFGNQLEVKMTRAPDKASESTSTSTRRKMEPRNP